MIDIPQNVIDRLLESESVVFFTGAGISAESGIPTFRGKDGIWNKLKPEELANFDAFLRNPEMVWEWYSHRKKIIHESHPNPGHLAIAEMQNLFNEVIVVTQNIDNLHRRAGSSRIYELHGNIERNYCIRCKTRYNSELPFEGKIPKCTNCGGLIRPDIVWFGEFLPQDQFQSSVDATRNCDVFFIVGTSAVVYPAASLIYTARDSGAYIIEVNIEETEISYLSNKSFYGGAGQILPAILEELKKVKNKG
jgi:NAD-dependent deacetylase